MGKARSLPAQALRARRCPSGPPPRRGATQTGKPVRPVPRASARRAVQQRRQRNLYTAYGAVAVVIVVIAVIVGINLAGGSKPKAVKGGAARRGVPAHVGVVQPGRRRTGQDPNRRCREANRAAPQPPDKLPASNKVLLVGGKPEVLFIGAEYCPYCAAERWALVMALSKFGTFSNVMGVISSSTDVNANTPTFSLYHSGYTSPYLSFVPVRDRDEDRGPAPGTDPRPKRHIHKVGRSSLCTGGPGGFDPVRLYRRQVPDHWGLVRRFGDRRHFRCWQRCPT